MRVWGKDGAPFCVVSRGAGGYVCYNMDGDGNREVVWTMDENGEYERRA